MLNKKIITNFIIFISFILSVLLSLFYVGAYDTYQLDQSTHVMLKEETYYHWFKAALIIEQIKNGASFFIAGEELFTKPLPQRLVAIYSYITNFNIVDDWKQNKISLGGKLPFLFTQSLIYYFSIFIFFKQTSKYFDANVNLLIIFFLCLEPTLFQYHSSFWTESFYFSIQLLLLSMMMSESKSNTKFIFIGILLGFLFIQRTAGFFYLLVILIYYFFTLKKDKYLKILLLILFYLIIYISVGLHNYKRMGIFYVMPTETKYGVYKYFSKDILKKVNNVSSKEINQQEVKKSFLWLEENGINVDYLKDYRESQDRNPYGIGLLINNEKDKIKYYSYLNKRAYKILLENPLITFKELINGFIHFSVLNPFFIYFDYEYYKDYNSQEIGDFVFSDKHKDLIPLRILYSLIIYTFVFFGIISCFKRNPKLCFLLLGSVFYYYVICGWYGKTRLFVPNLIYLSVFFGLGLNSILNKFKVYKKIIK